MCCAAAAGRPRGRAACMPEPAANRCLPPAAGLAAGAEPRQRPLQLLFAASNAIHDAHPRKVQIQIDQNKGRKFVLSVLHIFEILIVISSCSIHFVFSKVSFDDFNG